MPGATFGGPDVVNYIKRGVYDNYLTELSNAIEERDEARRRELHQRIQQVYGDEYEVVVRKREPDERPLGLSRRIAVDSVNCYALLADAATNGDVVTIDYTDANGAATTREILPLSIIPWSSGHTEAVRARDVAKDELRTFRLDRISRVEA